MGRRASVASGTERHRGDSTGLLSFLVAALIGLPALGPAQDAMLDGYWVLSTKWQPYGGMAVRISGTNYECWGYGERLREEEPNYPLSGVVVASGATVRLEGLATNGYNEAWNLFLNQNHVCLLTQREWQRYGSNGVFDPGHILYKLPAEAAAELGKAGLMPVLNYCPLRAAPEGATRTSVAGPRSATNATADRAPTIVRIPKPNVVEIEGRTYSNDMRKAVDSLSAAKATVVTIHVAERAVPTARQMVEMLREQDRWRVRIMVDDHDTR